MIACCGDAPPTHGGACAGLSLNKRRHLRQAEPQASGSSPSSCLRSQRQATHGRKGIATHQQRCNSVHATGGSDRQETARAAAEEQTVTPEPRQATTAQAGDAEDDFAVQHAAGDSGAGMSDPAGTAESELHQEQPSQLWEVPWDDWHTAGAMVQLWALMLPLGFGGVAIFGQLQGLTADTMGPADMAVAAAASELMQLAGAAAILWGACQRYQPLPQPWFRYRLDGGALLNGVAGGVASLAAVSLAAALQASGGSGGGTEVVQAMPRSQSEVGSILAGSGALGAAAAAFASVALAPTLEELVYRGFLLPSLTRRLPLPLAVILSSLVFAAAHLYPADAAPLFVLGCTLSVTTIAAEGNLLAPTLAHALYNGVVFAAAATR